MGLALGGLILLLIGLLAIPVELVFSIEHSARWRARIAVRGLFGLVRVRRTSGPRRRARETIRPARKKVSRHLRRPRTGLLSALVDDPSLRRRALRLLRDLIQAITVSGLRLRARLGLDDPADTGRLWGYLGAIRFALGGGPRLDVAVEPDFDQAVFALQGAGSVRFVPLRIIALCLGFVLSPITLRALWQRRAR